MLSVQFIKENIEQVKESLSKRNFANDHLIKQIIETDDQRKSFKSQLDDLLSKSNRISKEIGMLFKSGQIDKANEMKADTATMKEQSAVLKTQLGDIEVALEQLLLQMPNCAHPSVPVGKSDEDNEVFKPCPTALPELSEGSLPHWELAQKYDLIDFELGAKITGAGFPVYKGEGAMLQRALINFFLDEARQAGYIEYMVPHLVNADSARGTGQLPDKDGQMYYMERDDLYLIPTAEVPLTNIYRDVLLKESSLPIKLMGYTPCFRREAGSYGAHVRGLNRLHQFDKVEIVQVRKPDESYDALQEMCDHVESLLVKLGLPYRILRLCGGDLSFASALTFDFETYSAAQKRWLEVSSVSNFETFQANRLKLRYKDIDKRNKTLHTLNGSALALPRILATILENNQTEKGIFIPDVLQKYMGKEVIS